MRVPVVRKDIDKLQGKSMGRSEPLPSSLHPSLPHEKNILRAGIEM